MDHLFPYPKTGHSFLEILQDPLTRKLLGFDAELAEKTPFISGITSRLKFLLQDATKRLSFSKIGYTALEAFLQANCTGPPLDFNPEDVIFPPVYQDEIPDLRQEMIRSLSVDGTAVYALTPNIELFWLAHTIISNQTLAEEGFNGRRARSSVTFWHQKLLSEKSDTLRDLLSTDAEILEHQLASRLTFQGAAGREHFVEFLVERANTRTYYGEDVKAREDLARATVIRRFQFALTGALGKRTKYQDRDLSQLVVLAKSREDEPEDSRRSSRAERDSRAGSRDDHTSHELSKSPQLAHRPATPSSPLSGDHKPDALRSLSPRSSFAQPENLSLNDDTLLEQIHFKQPDEAQLTAISEHPPSQLEDLDPGNQPLLSPMDSIILLAIASSISNTSPSDGLTREETLPYATRVLEGGSSNWQVYTQALLVRSRIEGFRSRTAERGLLQLQALVDQVIVETTSTSSQTSDPTTGNFLPKPKASESASAAERLRYIHQISSPLRWELEAELAQRWTSMGGLKSALEIYERLQMQAEVALCLASTGREPEAIKLLRGILFDEPTEDTNDNTNVPPLKNPTPPDAPRLLCILGDITSLPTYYVLSWKTSSNRYARAQRSLGRHHVKNRNYSGAAEAYSKALGITRLDLPTWFALGCVQLELEAWPEAVESFTRCVQLEDKDAEAWSNLAVALLRLPVEAGDITKATATSAAALTSSSTPSTTTTSTTEPEEGQIHEEPQHPAPNSDSNTNQPPPDPHKHTQEALRALRRAAHLKREDARIWDNYLTVCASLPPPHTPWNEIIQAMSHVIELRRKREGESAVDLRILGALVDFILGSYKYPVGGSGEDGDGDSGGGGEGVQDLGDGKGELDANTTKQTDQPTTHAENPATDAQTHRPGLAFTVRAFQNLISQIAPLTSTPPLYALLSRVSLYRHRPAEALSYVEKAWRATIAVLGGYDSQTGWEKVVKETMGLVEAYRTLGPMEKERTGGVVEAKWEFKARSALRSVMGKGRERWEGSSGWSDLERLMAELKGG